MKTHSAPKRVALTFDDGPVEPYTSQILDILGEYGARATFFVIGGNVRLYPETVRRILREGHVLGNHTQNHNRWFGFCPDKLTKDILLCQDTLEDVTGMLPSLFRAPHGLAFGVGSFLAGQGLTRVGWNKSSHDWRLTSSDDITNRVLRSVRPEAIVLFHDGFPPDRPRNVRATAHDLARIIKTLKQRDYDCVTALDILRPAPRLCAQ